MKKEDFIKHGAIFAIPLFHDLGFLYGKMILGSELFEIPCRKKDIFIKVYDYHTEDLEEKINSLSFKDKGLFVDPFIMFGAPKLRGEYKWHFLFHDNIYDDDDYIPHYMQVSHFDPDTISPEQPIWILMYGNLNGAQNAFYPYRRVKHLPLHRGKSYDAIGIYLTFEWLRRKGEDPDKYFKYKEGLDMKKEIKYEVFKMVMDYRQVPENIRGRIVP